MYTSNNSKENLKRQRRAKKEFKTAPLFAFYTMLKLYPGYSFEEYLQDIKPKRKSKINIPAAWAQYGRFGQIQKLIARYQVVGKNSLIKKAIQIKKEIREPYKISARTPSGDMQFSFSAKTPFEQIEKLLRKINACKTSAKVLKVVAEFESASTCN
jgi:hypothetical protein